MSQRIFVAMPIPATLTASIEQWRLMTPAVRRLAQAPIRWLADKNLHLTLVPPWPETAVGKILEALVGMPKLNQALTLNFERVTFGPNLNSPRLIWAAGRTPPALINLKQSIERALARPPERRPFRLFDFRPLPAGKLPGFSC